MPLFCEDINTSAQLAATQSLKPQPGWTSPVYSRPNEGRGVLVVGSQAGGLKVFPVIDLRPASQSTGTLTAQATTGTTIRITSSPPSEVAKDKAVVDAGAGNNPLPTPNFCTWDDLVLTAGDVVNLPDTVTGVLVTGAVTVVFRRD